MNNPNMVNHMTDDDVAIVKKHGEEIRNFTSEKEYAEYVAIMKALTQKVQIGMAS